MRLGTVLVTITPAVFSGEKNYTLKLANGLLWMGVIPAKYVFNLKGKVIDPETFPPPAISCEAYVSCNVIRFLLHNQVLIEFPQINGPPQGPIAIKNEQLLDPKSLTLHRFYQ